MEYQLTRVAVLGLGTMGPGIVATLVRGGLSVSAYDPNQEAIDRAGEAVDAASKVLDTLARPQLSSSAPTLTNDFEECIQDADLVIENTPENLELKLEVLSTLGEQVSTDCILASDSSGIPITQLQEEVSNPSRVVGMHWSNPPHIIPMIEVIAGEQTSSDTVDAIVSLIQYLGLVPVTVKKDVPGFVENRILYALLRECFDLVEAGVIDPRDLDTCVSWGIGYKLAVIGPMALVDMAGLDIYESVASYLNQGLCNRSDVTTVVSDATKRGELGMKTGKGVYEYSPEEIKSLRAYRAKTLVAVQGAIKSIPHPT